MKQVELISVDPGLDMLTTESWHRMDVQLRYLSHEAQLERSVTT